MSRKITIPQIEDYTLKFYADEDPVRQEMESLARERGFPIIGPMVGRHLYQLARMIKATRIFELGSGYGYSALYFSRAVGAGGEVHCTELSAKNIQLAEQFLSRANLWERVTYHQEEAIATLHRVGGTWDIIYNDIDKAGYPLTVDLAYSHLKPGGLFITDNIFWSGRAMRGEADADTRGIIEFTQRLFAHPGFMTSIYPVRDGMTVALRQ